jgi:HTH-type transcriptional repressor of NAD biosynthesis genes
MERITRGQAASEDALARNANRVLVADTDALATLVWSDVLFGTVPPAVREFADARAADLYLLTDADVPWVADPVRYLPGGGAAFFDRCRAELDARGRRYIVVRGTWEERFHAAAAAVEGLLHR